MTSLEVASMAVDTVFLATANENYLAAFKESVEFQSFKGRMELVRVPYLLDYRLEVDSSPHDQPATDVRLVVFSLLHGGVVAVEVVEIGEALDPLGDQVAIRHRMADDGRAETFGNKQVGEKAGRRTLAGPRPHGADGNHRDRRVHHRTFGSKQAEIRTGRQDAGGLMHDELMRDIAVGEDHLVHPLAPDQVHELALGDGGDALWIQGSGELRRVPARVDTRDLR